MSRSEGTFRLGLTFPLPYSLPYTEALTPRQKLDLQQAQEQEQAVLPSKPSVRFAEPAPFEPDAPRGGGQLTGGHLSALELFARKARSGKQQPQGGGIAELGQMADGKELWEELLQVSIREPLWSFSCGAATAFTSPQYHEFSTELADRYQRANEEIHHLHMIRSMSVREVEWGSAYLSAQC